MYIVILQYTVLDYPSSWMDLRSFSLTRPGFNPYVGVMKSCVVSSLYQGLVFAATRNVCTPISPVFADYVCREM